MICKMLECTICKKKTVHRLVTDTTMCLICGNYSTNKTPYETTGYCGAVKTPGGESFVSADTMFKHLESDI